MANKKLNISNSHGSTLILAMLIIGLLAVMALVFADNDSRDEILESNLLTTERAFYLAETGLTKAMIEIHKDAHWRGTILEMTPDNGQFAAIVLDSKWNRSLADTILVRATGNFDGATANVEAWLAPRKVAGSVDNNSDSSSYEIVAWHQI